jgi:hypothetical protein
VPIEGMSFLEKHVAFEISDPIVADAEVIGQKIHVTVKIFDDSKD